MQFLKYGEVAEILRVSPVTLRKKVAEGVLPHYKPFGPHGPVRFSIEDINQFLEASRRGGSTERE